MSHTVSDTHWFDFSGCERQPPLVLRWEVRSFWKALQTILPSCDEPTAAIALAIVENAMNGDEWTSYSRDRSFYGASGEEQTSVLHTYRRIVPTIDRMDAEGLIEHDRRRPAPRGCGWRSALRPMPALVEAVKSAIALVGRPIPNRPDRPIILRDSHGEEMALPKTRFVERMSAQVDEINRLHVKADVSTGSAAYRRIFNGDFSRGGRFYAIGAAWQAMPEAQRAQIMIGGERTVEIDYKAMHPTLIYHAAGLAMPVDAYEIGDWDRNLMKIAFLVLVNAKDIDQACWSIARKAQMSSVAEPRSSEAEATARELVDAIRERHRAIEKAFCSDAGARMQRIESDIVGRVMTRLAREGEVALPVHDSLIVRETAADVLEEVMVEEAAKVGLTGIRVERKGGSEGSVRRDGSSIYGIRAQNVLTYPSLSSFPSPSFQNESLAFGSPASLVEAPCERSELRTPPEADDYIESSLITESSGTAIAATHVDAPARPISAFDTCHTPDVPLSSTFPQTPAFASEEETPFIFNPSASLAHAEIRLDMSEPDFFSTASADPSTSTIAADTDETLQEARTSQDANPPKDAVIPAPTSSETPSPVSQANRVGFRLEQELSLGGKLTIWSKGEDCSWEAVASRQCILRHVDGAGRRTTRRFADWASCKVIADDIRHGSAFVRTTFNGRYDPTPKPVVPRGMGFVERWRAGLIKRNDQEWAPILRMLPGATIREVRLRDERQN